MSKASVQSARREALMQTQRRHFVVVIDRGRMVRRYVLKTIDDQDGAMVERINPMTAEEFREHYGFSETFPHEWIKR